MSKTTIKLSGGDLGREEMQVRCDLSQASSPVEVDYCEGSGWQPTQWQAASCAHRTRGLVSIGKQLAAAAVEMAAEDFACDWEEINVRYVIREVHDWSYWNGNDWSPCADQAREYECQDDANTALRGECSDREAMVYEREGD